VLCTFRQLDPVVKNELLKSYCLSLYGCELWDLSNTDIENVCKAWLSGLRRIWALPMNCRSAFLCIVTDTVPLFDLIYKHSTMFVRWYLDSESLIVRSVAVMVSFTANWSEMFRLAVSFFRYLNRPCYGMWHVSLAFILFIYDSILNKYQN